MFDQLGFIPPGLVDYGEEEDLDPDADYFSSVDKINDVPKESYDVIMERESEISTTSIKYKSLNMKPVNQSSDSLAKIESFGNARGHSDAAMRNQSSFTNMLRS